MHDELQARRESKPNYERQEVARHVLWAFGDRVNGYRPGSFTEKLLEAWARADMYNSLQLGVAFPRYGEAIDILNQRGISALFEWAGIEERP